MDIIKGLFKEFDWFIWGLLGLGLIWFFTGGPQSETAHEGQFLKPPAPLDTGEGYGRYYEGSDYNRKQTLNLPQAPADLLRKAGSGIESFFTQSEEAKKIHIESLLSKRLSFDAIAGAREGAIADEYIRIVASEFAASPISVSGLLLRGTAFDSSVIVPKAANLPLPGTTAAKSDVVLPPGGRALVTTGRSPIGTSFRANICTGYLNQFQTYVPELRNDCPSPTDELERAGLAIDPVCREFVEKIPRCKIYQGSYPAKMSAECQAFVVEKLNYNACVANHKNDKGFYLDEWRLFLDQPRELWRNKNEIIRLIDSKGKTVDAITY